MNENKHKNWRADEGFMEYAKLRWSRDLERINEEKSQTVEKKFRDRYTGWLGAVDFFFNVVKRDEANPSFVATTHNGRNGINRKVDDVS